MSCLIALEGGDGVGKATQSSRLVENLKASGRGAVLYSFPRYDTDVGRAICRHLTNDIMVACEHAIDSSDHEVDGTVVYRRAPEDALFFQSLMLADKYGAEPEIEDHLRQGRFVVCDRWKASALAYGAADGLPVEWLERIHERLTSASMTILLEVPEAVALERRFVLRDRYERDRGKQAQVVARYAELAKKGRWQVVDGNQTVAEVSRSIWWHVSKRFGL